MKKHSLAKVFSCFAACALFLPACGGGGVPEHDHVYDAGEVTKEATCHSEGVKTYHCTVKGCNQTKLETLEMTPHNWNQGEIKTPATCGENGKKVYTCLNEGCGQTKETSIPKTGDHHFEEGPITVIPDLLEEGERVMVCSVCHEESVEAVAPRADASEQFGMVTTHFTFGSLSSYSLSDENLLVNKLNYASDAYKDSIVEFKKGEVSVNNGVAALGYDFSSYEDMRVHVSFSYEGNSDADKVTSYFVIADKEGKVRLAKELENSSSKLSYEPKEEIEVIKGDTLYLLLAKEGAKSSGKVSFTLEADCVHVYDEGKVTKAPTCQEEGVYTYTCIKCGETKTRALAKVDHSYDEGVVTKEPTETETGVKTYTCSVCHTTKEEVIPALGLRIASYHDDFSTSGNSSWLYGYSENYDYEHNTFDFVALEKVDDNTWGGVDGLTAKSDWVQSEAEGKDLAIGYLVPRGQTTLKLDISFASVTAAQGETRMAARVLVVDPLGNTKSASFLDDGQRLASWTANLEVEVNPGDKVYTILFRESAAWPQGKLDIEIHGNAIPSTDPYLDLTGKVITRFDDANGTIPLSANSWASLDGLEAHVEVTTACDEIWRAGMFIDTGIALKAGKSYDVTFDVSAKNDGPFEVILQPSQWAKVEERFAFIQSTGNHKASFTVNSDTTLWFLVQAGSAINEITVSRILVEEKEPVDTGDYVNMIGKVETRFDDAGGTIDLAANSWTSQDGLTAYAEVTVPCSDIWRAGMFINSGVEMEVGKSYAIEFDIAAKNDAPFEVILQNGQWADVNHRYDFISSTGHYSKTITVEEGMEGSLWILVQFGTSINEISISRLLIEETEPVVDNPYLDLKGKVETRFDDAGGTIELGANTWTSEDGLTAYAEVTTPCEDIWRAGMFINTGIEMEVGKSYSVEFDVSAKNEAPFELILQNGQWADVDHRYDFSTATGHYSKTIEVTTGMEGSLWILVQFGNSVNEIAISNILIEEAEPAEPNYINLLGKVETRFDDAGGTINLGANTWTSEDGLTAYAEVTTPCEDIWRAGMFINTGVEMEVGKSYAVEFDVSAKNDAPFELILQNGQWADVDHRYDFSTATGHYSKTIDVTTGMEGTLWILVQFGNSINEISISKILVEETEPAPAPNYINLTGKVETRFDDAGGTIALGANTWTSDDGLTAYAEVTTPCEDIWRAGMFINTGVEMEVGKSYSVEFDVTAKNDAPFELILQNGQWADVDHRYDFSTATGHYSKTITVEEGMEGSLWILVQFGNSINEISISNIQVSIVL